MRMTNLHEIRSYAVDGKGEGVSKDGCEDMMIIQKSTANEPPDSANCLLTFETQFHTMG
jgi:hypothetical protein